MCLCPCPCGLHGPSIQGWNSHVHRGLSAKFDSSNVSRRNVSRRIGRMRSVACMALAFAVGLSFCPIHCLASSC